MNARTTDVVVVGAGVVGCSIAQQLSRRGLRVTVLDTGSSPGSGSTSYSSAIVRFNYSTSEGVRTAWESHEAWQEWRDHLSAPRDEPLARYEQIGGVVLQPPGEDMVNLAGLLREERIPHETWTPEELKARLPMLDVGRYGPPARVDDDRFWSEPTGELGACYTADAGYVNDPHIATGNLARSAQRRGARFVFRSTVTSVLRRGGRVRGVVTDSGDTYEARIVINATGPHSARLNQLAAVLDDFKVSTRPLRQEVHVVPTVPGYGVPTSPFVADPDLGIYFRPEAGGQILVGGLEPECDPLVWVEDPDEYDPLPTTAGWTAQVYRLARRVPGVGVPHRPRGAAGLYDVTDDWIPVYDRTSLDGYYVAIGTSGNQFKNAPVIGHLMAELIEACENGHDHDGSPVRVMLQRSGAEVSLGHYSRRREVRGAAFNVFG